MLQTTEAYISNIFFFFAEITYRWWVINASANVLRPHNIHISAKALIGAQQ